MKVNKKFLALASVAAVALPVTVWAATTTIEATANFQTAITLGNEVNMDFSNVEFSAAPAGGDTASLGTDGAIAYAGNFGGAGTGTPGEVEITAGDVGATVEIFCDVGAIMAEAGGGTIDVVSVGVSMAPAAFGALSACNGTGGAAATTHVLAGGGADVILLGGQIDGGTAVGFVAGAYSTATAGGDDIQVDVFYQ